MRQATVSLPHPAAKGHRLSSVFMLVALLVFGTLAAGASLPVSAAIVGEFTPTAPYTFSNPQTAAARLADGGVLIVAGWQAVLYDARTNSFAPRSGIPFHLVDPAAITLNDGRVLIVGTLTAGSGGAFVFNPQTDTFQAVGAMVTPRHHAVLAPLPDGRILVASGRSIVGDRPVARQAELFDPITNTFSATGTLTADRYLPAHTVLADGRVLLVGGIWLDPQTNQGFPLRTVELYNPDTGRFTGVTQNMQYTRARPTATTLPDGRVLIAGGKGYGPYFGDLRPLMTSEVFVPSTLTFEPFKLMASTRWFHGATLQPDGSVLITGGETDIDGVSEWAEVFMPEEGRWRTVNSLLTVSRYQHVMVPLDGGRVLLTGGTNYEGSHERGDIFTPDKIMATGFQ